MRVVEAPDVVDGGEEGGGGDGADTGDEAQARHTRILDGEVLDPVVAVRERLSEGPHSTAERPARRAWTGDGPITSSRYSSSARRHPISTPTAQRIAAASGDGRWRVDHRGSVT
jgi:hypothetical protein